MESCTNFWNSLSGRARLPASATLCNCCTSFPDSDLLLVLVSVARLLALLILSGFSALHWLVKSELFPAEIRALGVGLPFAVISSIMGGTTEFVALRLKEAGHESAFFYYVSACAAVSLVTILLLPETRRNSTLDR